MVLVSVLIVLIDKDDQDGGQWQCSDKTGVSRLFNPFNIHI